MSRKREWRKERRNREGGRRGKERGEEGGEWVEWGGRRREGRKAERDV